MPGQIRPVRVRRGRSRDPPRPAPVAPHESWQRRTARGPHALRSPAS